MILISHRGNVSGPTPKKENHPKYIISALNKGYFVEVDVWWDKQMWLGHDKPQYKIPSNIWNKNVIFHCKNLEALNKFNEFYDLHTKYIVKHITNKSKYYHYFWHQNDDYTLTSYNKIWVYPNKPLIPESICVMPELGINGDIDRCWGICSDFIGKYRNQIS